MKLRPNFQKSSGPKLTLLHLESGFSFADHQTQKLSGSAVSLEGHALGPRLRHTSSSSLLTLPQLCPDGLGHICLEVFHRVLPAAGECILTLHIESTVRILADLYQQDSPVSGP
jgi:hypothetical protein